MNARFRLAAVAAALLLSTAIVAATLPARLAARWVDRDKLALSGVRGTVWQGSAVRAVATTVMGPLHLGVVQWRVHPWSLFTLSPSVSLESRWGSQQFVARLWRRGDRWELRDVDAMLDARLLSQLMPAALRGRISIQLDSATATEREVLGARGRVVWQDASWQSGSGNLPLGNFVALLESDAEGLVRARIETLSGPLQAQGEIRLEGRGYNAEARIEAPGGMEPQLSRALSLIAEPRDNGFDLRIRGELGRLP